ncbi:hypothetical protein MKX01_021678, partial [Papaver californicum]
LHTIGGLVSLLEHLKNSSAGIRAKVAEHEGNPIIVDWKGRVCCGYLDPNDPDVDIRIIDPETGIEHEEYGKEREIWN